MKQLHRSIPSILLAGLMALGATGCSKNKRAARMLAAGDRDYAAEKYDDAEAEYKSALLMRVPASAMAIGRLGLVYAKEGRTMEAGSYLVQGAKQDPNNLPIQIELGKAYASFHDVSNATRIAIRVLTAQPTNEEAMMILGNGFMPPPAVWSQVSAIPGVANNPNFHLVQAKIDMGRKKFQDAANELKLVLAARPKSADAYLALAELHSLQKQEKEAGEAFQTAAAYSPLRSLIRTRFIDYLIQTHRSDEAEKALKELHDKAPDYIPGWTVAMNIALSQRRVDDAEKYANIILGRDPNDFEGLMGSGTVSMAKGDAAKALATFQRMNSIYKTSAQARYELALATMLNHDKVKAVSLLNEALLLDPMNAQVNLLLAQLDIRNGDSTSAIALLKQFIQKSPGSGQAYVLLAEAYIAQKNPQAALSIYRDLARKLPKNPQVPLMIGMVLENEGKMAEARRYFESSLAMAPDYQLATEQLINLDLAEHRYNDARALVQKQIDRSPKAAQPWELMAKIDVARTNYPAAEKSLLKAIDLNPDLTGPYLLLAQVYVTSTNYQQALDKLNALVARTNDVSAFLQIGAIHYTLKDYKAARDSYEKALGLNPKSPPALNNLAYIYAVELGNMPRAYELAERARQILPYDPHVADTLGWVLFKKGDYPRAMAMLEESSNADPTDPEIQYHLGMAHYMMDEEDSARAALRRAVSTPVEYANKQEARNVLAVLDSEHSGSPASALAALQKELDAHPDDPVILNRVAALEEDTGAYQKAAGTYEKALKQTPDAVHIMARLARVYALDLNDPDKAMKLAADAHKSAPDNAEVDAILGHLALATGDTTWALSLLQSAGDQISNDPQLYYDLAWAKYANGQVSDAQTAMEKAAARGGKSNLAAGAKQFLTLVNASGRASQVQAALPEARTILQSNAKYVPAIMVTAESQDQAGNFGAARDGYNQALAIYPALAPALRQLAILDARHFPDDAKGYAVAEKARAAYPDDPAVARSLGILSYQQGNYQRSADLLQESASKAGEDGELDFYLGMDYYQLKRKTDSRNALGRALALKIPDQLAAEAKHTLAGLK